VPIAIESVKVTIQELPAPTSTPSPLTAASGPSPSASVVKVPLGLVACEHAEARASTHWVLKFLDKMKSAVDDQESE
jgi:hypothetical protein